jgi:hypothetical protein
MQQIKFQYPIHIIYSKQLGLEFYYSFHFPSNQRCRQKFFYECSLLQALAGGEKGRWNIVIQRWYDVVYIMDHLLPCLARRLPSCGLTGCCHCCVIKLARKNSLHWAFKGIETTKSNSIPENVSETSSSNLFN